MRFYCIIIKNGEYKIYMKNKKIIPLMMAMLILPLVSCNNTTSDSSGGSSGSATTSSSTGGDETSTYDTLAACSSYSVGKKVKILATITGTDGAGFYLQDKTGYFYAYYEDIVYTYTIGNKVEIEGSISEYKGNKQIAKNFTMIDMGAGDETRIVEVSSLDEMKNNKYAPVKANVKLSSINYSAGNDSRNNVVFDDTPLILFIKRQVKTASQINSKLTEVGLNNYFTIQGGFSNAFDSIPQFNITDPSQIIVNTIDTEEQKIRYAEDLIDGITSLNNTKINYSLELPTTAEFGVSFSWSSSNTACLTNAGKVIRPEGNKDVSVTLNCDIKINDVTKKSISIKLTIIGKDSTTMPENVASYYKNIDFTKSDSTLKTSLYTLIKDHTVISYSNLVSVYADSDSYTKNGQKYIIDIYTNQEYTISQSGSSATKEGSGWNKEHTVPKSWFNEASPMESDAFHIYPTDIFANSKRSNYPYGEVKTVSWESSNGTKLGTSTSSSVKGSVFEIADEYKGDIARVYFYMVTAYEDKCANWDNCFDNSNYSKLTTYYLNLFMKWAKNDPVSEREILRNNGVYKHQGNRNPYVDDASLAEKVFGSLVD